jgi:hypothetical protein
MSYDEEGYREDWRDKVAAAGYRGDTETLWETMVSAREANGFGLPPNEIAADKDKFESFRDAVRESLGVAVEDNVIATGLMTMPRTCDLCGDNAWEPCETCGGCESCCCEDFHCIDHGTPFNFCRCELSNFRDGHGDPPPI